MTAARQAHREGFLLRRLILPAVLAVACFDQASRADEAQKLGAAWNDQFTELKFNFRGREVRFPDSVDAAACPPAGAKQQVDVKTDWPVVSLKAAWSISAADWPKAHRQRALDFVLMRTCDVRAHQQAYPEVVLSSTMKYPPQFVNAANHPSDPLAKLMRGKSIVYEIVAEGGFGAADPVITTKIIAGLSQDEKTVFYHDQPLNISDNLANRESIVAARDMGDRICIQVYALYVCAPRSSFRDVALGRVSKSITYLVERMFANLSKAPSGQDLQRYYEIVRKMTQSLKAVDAPSGGQAGGDTRSLANTRWRVVERTKPDGTPDGKFKEMQVEFQPQGRMVTTATLADGKQERVEQAFKWDVTDNAITLTGAETTPQGPKEYRVVAMYEFQGDRLRVVSDRFVIVAEAVK